MSDAHTNANTNYHGHTHLYYRKHPINYHTYPRGSYGHQIHLDRDYYKKAREINSAYTAAAEKAAKESKTAAEKAATAAAAAAAAAAPAAPAADESSNAGSP